MTTSCHYFPIIDDEGWFGIVYARADAVSKK